VSTFSAIGGIPVAQRVSRFSYAIRNIVDAAYAEEARGRTVRYLNIGDPAAFGFNAPPHMIEAVSHALRNNQNGYLPSVGVLAAREAVAAEYTRKGLPIGAERVIITQGSSEGIDLALTALVNEGEEVLVPSPSYPLYTAVLATLGAKAVYYPSDPTNDWLPDLDRLRDLVTSRTRALVIIDPNNPTGAVYPESLRRAMIDFADSYGLTILADEVYGELGFEGPVPLLGSLAPEAPILSFSSLSKAWLTPGWRTGWLVASPTSRLDGVLSGVRKLADARLCSPGPMQYAVPAALNGDRSHQQPFREALAERARIVVDAFSTIPGGRCVPPRAAFYAMPSVPLPPGRTDEEYVLALLRETGILCVHGSGFGVAPDAGCLRIVFLADPRALIEIGREIADFTAHYMETAQLPTGLGTGDH
jgi:aspartate/methionine/tyrosine aminotransferase